MKFSVLATGGHPGEGDVRFAPPKMVKTGNLLKNPGFTHGHQYWTHSGAAFGPLKIDKGWVALEGYDGVFQRLIVDTSQHHLLTLRRVAVPNTFLNLMLVGFFDPVTLAHLSGETIGSPFYLEDYGIRLGPSSLATVLVGINAQNSGAIAGAYLTRSESLGYGGSATGTPNHTGADNAASVIYNGTDYEVNSVGSITSSGFSIFESTNTIAYQGAYSLRAVGPATLANPDILSPLVSNPIAGDVYEVSMVVLDATPVTGGWFLQVVFGGVGTYNLYSPPAGLSVNDIKTSFRIPVGATSFRLMLYFTGSLILTAANFFIVDRWEIRRSSDLLADYNFYKPNLHGWAWDVTKVSATNESMVWSGAQGTAAGVSQNVTVKVGREYCVSVELTGVTAGSVSVGFASGSATVLSASGVSSFLISSPVAATRFEIIGSADFAGTLTYVRLRDGFPGQLSGSEAQAFAMVGGAYLDPVIESSQMAWVSFNPGSYAELPYSTNLGNVSTTEFTFTLWVSNPLPVRLAFGGVIVSHSYFTGPQDTRGDDYFQAIGAVNDQWTFRVRAGVVQAEVTSSTPLDDAKPHLISGVRTSTSLQIYLDGVLDAEILTPTLVCPVNPNARLYIGGEPRGGGGAAGLKIGGFSYYTQALTAAKQRLLYLEGISAYTEVTGYSVRGEDTVFGSDAASGKGITFESKRISAISNAGVDEEVAYSGVINQESFTTPYLPPDELCEYEAFIKAASEGGTVIVYGDAEGDAPLIYGRRAKLVSNSHDLRRYTNTKSRAVSFVLRYLDDH